MYALGGFALGSKLSYHVFARFTCKSPQHQFDLLEARDDLGRLWGSWGKVYKRFWGYVVEDVLGGE